MHILQKLREASIEREKYWNPYGQEIPQSFRCLELAGEVGEVANAVKKIMRHQLGMVGGSADDTNLKEEIGDVLISLELLARSFNYDLWQCAVEKFNKTSDKNGFPIKMDNEGNIINEGNFIN
jgi:NTP pyrophosphatase (non-canonical NTP hydrolase)